MYFRQLHPFSYKFYHISLFILPGSNQNRQTGGIVVLAAISVGLFSAQQLWKPWCVFPNTLVRCLPCYAGMLGTNLSRLSQNRVCDEASQWLK